MGVSNISERNRGEDESVVIRISWDTGNPKEVKAAEAKFKEHVRSGWLAYYLTDKKEKVQIFTFNPNHGEVFLIPLVEGG